MMSMAVVFMVLLTNLTPLNLALTVTMMSMVVSMVAYSMTLSVFPSTMIIISFSSGTMIVFCYCAMMVNYIQKSSKSLVFNTMVMMVSPMIMVMMKMTDSNNSMNIMKNMTSSYMIPMAMLIVVLSMVCINSSMYKKGKPLKMSY